MTVCPTCGEENPARARFCSELWLGASRGARAVARGAQGRHGPVLRPGRVHRTLGQGRPRGRASATLRVYHALLERTIEQFGGTVEKFIGDAVIGGVRRPRGARGRRRARHPRRRCGSWTTIEEANEEQPGLELAVRIGINTGEAVVAFGAADRRWRGERDRRRREHGVAAAERRSHRRRSSSARRRTAPRRTSSSTRSSRRSR